MSKSNMFSDEELTNAQKDKHKKANTTIEQGGEINPITADMGIMGTKAEQKYIWFNANPTDYIVGDRASAPIVMLPDRPVGAESGFGGKGAQNCHTIDLVVGRMSSVRGGKGPAASETVSSGDTEKIGFGFKSGEPVAVVENSYAADAARIYISQMTLVDKNFGLAEGMMGAGKPRSTVALKADGVRVIGREGVKIVTGRSHAFKKVSMTGELNSRGGKIQQPSPPIELIAGNSDKFLQGIAKGENTRDALRDLGEIVEEIISAVFTMSLTQLLFNSVMGVSAFEPWRPAALPLMATTYINRVILSIWMSRVNKITWDVNYLQPFGDKPIISKNVFCT